MKAGTFFSGIDAPEVSAPRFDWCWRAEIDPFANAVSEFHRPGVPNLGDMEKADFDHAEPVELVVFGSPCQSFSVAGKRLGLDDPRGNLALVALAAIGRIRPRWFVFENVPGLLSSDGGRDFGAFLGAVGQLGYGWAYRTLDAQHFGVPQRRRRVFVVGCLGDWRGPAAVLFERESLHGHFTPGREAGQGTTGTFSAGAHPGSYNGQDAHNDLLVAHALRAEGFDAGEDGTGKGTPLVVFQPNDPGEHIQGRIAPTLRPTHDGGSYGSQTAIAFSAKDHGADAGHTSPTLRAGGHLNSHANAGVMPAVAFTPHGADKTVSTATETNLAGSVRTKPPGSIENSSTTAVLQAASVRRLTPTECEALQGFPRNYTRVSYRNKPASQCPDGPRYKALGNSMAVPCIGWVLNRLDIVERIRARAA